MRARTNAASRRAEAPVGDGVSKVSQEEDGDCNGKDKPKFKRPMATFKLPPPPRMASLSGAAKNGDKSVSKVNDAAINHDSKASESDGSENLAVNSITGSSSTPAIPLVPSVPIPPPPSSTSVVYQRVLRRNPQTTDVHTTSEDNTNTTGDPNNSYISHTSSASHQSQQYHQSSSYSQISHPYKPSSWYADARNLQRKRQILINFIGVVIAIVLVVSFWQGYQYYLSSRKDVVKTKHHKKYHHHDHHYQFHPMLGIDESPLGFAKEKSPKKRSYRQLEQDHASSDQTSEEGQTGMHDLFSTFPVTTLSNQRLLPYVGFGVSSRSVEHKQIPIIISTLLQYASSETEGGGGIAMIDAVIDEDRKLENDGGSLQYSTSNKKVERYEEEEEKVESSMAKTVVTLVGRAIGFFGKENWKRHSSEGMLQSSKSKPRGDDAPYDYENRLEVHLLVGLSGPDLGVDNTIAALRDIVAELDGLVPPFPKDVLYTDLSEWKKEPTPLTTVDHHVDVRLHVLLRLNHCHNRLFKVAPCSSDEATNRELLERWIGSYTILERLYTGKIIHGIGLDAIHGEDIKYLLKKCTIKPQLYRGDVSQALDVYGRRMGSYKNEHIATILKENNMTFLASNVAGHILQRKGMAPNAYSLLQNLGGVLYRAHHEMLTARGDAPMVSTGHKGEGQYYTVPRLVLSYLVRHKVCVLPHAYKAEHLADDAPESVGGIANFLTERRVAEIGAALKALLSESDLPEDHGLGMEGEKEIAAVFHNMLAEEVHLFRVDKNGATSSEGDGSLKKDGSVVMISNAGDKFTAYGSDGQKRGTYIVKAEGGGAIDFTIPDGQMDKI
ncbi:hypothetical protein ACHAXR_008854 [Thalassiosira sp. AJA248-18]